MSHHKEGDEIDGGRAALFARSSGAARGPTDEPACLPPPLRMTAAYTSLLVVVLGTLLGGRAQAQEFMGRAKFDDETGAPLNKAARDILARHSEGVPTTSGGAAGGAEAFDALNVVDVAAGTWKFVLLEVELGDRRRQIVRALEGLKFHAENYDVVASLLKPFGMRVRVVGGGRITRDDATKAVQVYGYSKTFGRSPGCNERTAAILRENLPGYDVTWSDSGY